MLSLPQAVRVCFRKYAVFNGRATRAEFWWWVLASNLAVIAAAAVDAVLSALFAAIGVPFFSPLAVVTVMGIVLPSLAVAVRRLHDIDKSGWWLLVWYCIDFVASLFLVVSLAVLVLLFAFGIVEGGWSAKGVLSDNVLVLIAVFPFVIISLVAILAVYAWALVWLVRQGGPGDNRFGPDPRVWPGGG